jgi:SAM-dependent methyltransferase
MSGDGPSKVAPSNVTGGEPLDDIILGDDEPTDVVADTRPKPSSPPPIRAKLPELPSAPPPAPSAPPPPKRRPSVVDESELREAQKKRAKLTLRIPDDEISRPNLPASTPVAGVQAIASVTSPSRPPSAPEVEPVRARTVPPPQFNADDTIELPSDEVRARLAAFAAAPAVGIDASQEPGWTPFQPEVADEAPPPDRIQPTPIVDIGRAAPPPAERPANGGARAHDPRETVLDMHEVHNSSPPISEDIPVDMDLGSVPEVATTPHLPRAYDSEEIRIEEGDRVSETGEVEVLPEDLVSVESLPSPAYNPPPVKTAGKYAAFKAGEPTATALMAAGPAVAARPQSTPSQPPVAAAAVAPMSPVTALPAGAGSPHAQVIGTPGPAARRTSNPMVFVPPVGALAPPPMTDTAANRKKVRPWWEELFNDDFIRTMAKVTDAQIGKEVNFIEESLGCEAGAMVLDLACGTGRHAVELAARGYQVVGFDLSLAMLARASDEAQDRKQKINFVQGDMREMTFEETFDGVYSWNTSFGYFDEEKNGAVIARVHKALKKGGQFLLDVVNRDYIVRQAPSLAWFEGDGCICMDEMTIDFITSRMKVKRTLMMDDGRTKEIEYSIRTYALHELGKMLHDNGFRVAEVSGRTGTPGVFFGCESPRTLILAEKR